MSERKSDELTAAGTHRAWAGAGETETTARAGSRNESHAWLERPHSANPPANPRHAAITDSLHSWSNYKSWTDKVRNSWDKKEDK